MDKKQRIQRLIISVILVFIIVFSCQCGDNNSGSNKESANGVTIVKRENYYEVVLDFSSGISHYEMGRQYAYSILQQSPDIQGYMDSYLQQITFGIYDEMFDRIEDIKDQIPKDYLHELEGLASLVMQTTENVAGDGLLSKDELFMLNLLPDIARTTKCSAVSVFGSRSATGNTMVARNLDWFPGLQNELLNINAVTTIRNGEKSIITIGYLGMMGALTAFNDNGVFAAILDSGVGDAYESKNRYSYIFDVRYALENHSTLVDVADYLDDHDYTYNHLIFLADATESQVLENNISGSGANIHRALRASDSILNSGITWGFTDAVASVNAFMLEGNHDNYSSNSSNTARWATIIDLMTAAGDKVDYDELKNIASFDNGDGPDYQSTGDLYNNGSLNSGTLQIVLFQPKSGDLDVFFRQPDSVPDNPNFDSVSVSF